MATAVLVAAVDPVLPVEDAGIPVFLGILLPPVMISRKWSWDSW